MGEPTARNHVSIVLAAEFLDRLKASGVTRSEASTALAIAQQLLPEYLAEPSTDTASAAAR